MNIVLDDILKSCIPYTTQGKVANYIPELAKADTSKFGICVITAEGDTAFAGDYNFHFTIQSH